MGKRATLVSLSDLIDCKMEPVTPERFGKSKALFSGLAAAVLLGILAAATATPLVVAGAMTVQEGADFWEGLPTTLPDVPAPTRSVILAADGTQIAQFYSENRVEVSAGELPQVVKDAVVAVEDARFYEHTGVDPKGIVRAAASNALNDTTQGGSTLTQQYVKNRLLNAAEDDEARREVTSRTSYMRKLREARLAVAVEKEMTKDEILLGYLNISYFGDGAYGIGTAARHFFDKKVADLTLPEAALLVGLVRNPSGYNPTENPSAATTRRNVVLRRMMEVDYITPERYQRASTRPLRLNVTKAPNGCTTSKYPFYCQWVKEELESDPAFGATQAQRNELLFRGGLTIKTPLDVKKQGVAQRAVDEALGRENRVASTAVTVEPGTGHVVSMAFNRDFGKSKPGRFNATEIILPNTPMMQPGSAFKPITLAAALERGFDPRSVINAPYRYSPYGQAAPAGGFSNYSQSSGGNLDAYAAIARSSNTWFIRLQEQMGVLSVASMAERLGITSIPRSGPRAITHRDASLTLGTYEVSPVELAGAYATFAAHGVHCKPTVITGATNRDGDDIAVPDPECHEAIPASVADTVATIMAGTIDGPDEYRTGKAQSLGRPAAGKTGTTQNTAAVWFAGFTPQYATAVWVGDPRGGFRYPLRGFYAYGSYVPKATGGSVAGPIWRNVMSGIHAGLPKKRFRAPSVTLAHGTVVPDVRGMSLGVAYRTLTKAGFDVALATKNAKRDKALRPDVVAATTPAAGTFLGTGTEVTVRLTARSDRAVRLR